MSQTIPSQPATEAKPTLYFAYGSNLSLTQMKQRCPGFTYMTVACLRGWRWVISPRGYANIVPCRSFELDGDGGASEKVDEGLSTIGDGSGRGTGTMDGKESSSVVYGLVYSLSLDGEDEESLDDAEGVPWAYEKVWMDVDVDVQVEDEDHVAVGVKVGDEDVSDQGQVKPANEDRLGLGAGPVLKSEKLNVLVYVDRRGEERLGKARDEYVFRMNRGIDEAVSKGLPMRYVEEVIRPFIPALE